MLLWDETKRSLRSKLQNTDIWASKICFLGRNDLEAHKNVPFLATFHTLYSALRGILDSVCDVACVILVF